MDRESSALPSLLTVMFDIFLASFFMQIVTATTLIMSTSESYILIGKIMIVVAFCLLLLAFCWTKAIIAKGRNAKVYDEYLRKLDEDLYHHPMDKVHQP